MQQVGLIYLTVMGFMPINSLHYSPPAWRSTVASFYNWRVVKVYFLPFLYQLKTIINKAKARGPSLH